MTMNYCGRCGAANGTAARYCRQCGAELHSQAAFSSASTPLNVEFSARNAVKDRAREARVETTTSAIPDKPDTAKLSKPTGKTTPQVTETNGEVSQDPKAISESLKRLRASGPLIVEAVKKKQDRINQIIAESIEGKGSEAKADAKSDGKSEASNDTHNDGKPDVKPQSVSTLPKNTPPAKTQISSPQITQSAGNAATPVPRRSAATLMPVSSMRSAGSSSSVGGAGQLPPQGPSSVLAQASGLGKNSNFGSKLRLSLIAAIVVLTASSYFLLRDRLATPSRLADAGRNLLSAEEQSSYLVKLGQRDREQGHYDTAIGYFQNALTLTPNNSDVRFLLAQTYANAGQSDEALRGYQSVLRIAPEHLEARLQIAEIHRLRGNWAAAMSEYQRIIALDQNSPQAAVALEAMEAHESGKTETADAKLRRQRSVAQKTPVKLPGMTDQPQVSILPQRAVAVTGIKPPTTNRVEERPDPRAAADGHKKLGLRYFNVREYRAAINEFLSALRLTPEDKDLLYFIGSSYYGMGQPALAHDYYKRVDSGNYVGVAQSGAARTEKAAREEYKRRELIKSDPQNQVKSESNQKSKRSPSNSLE